MYGIAAHRQISMISLYMGYSLDMYLIRALFKLFYRCVMYMATKNRQPKSALGLPDEKY